MLLLLLKKLASWIESCSAPLLLVSMRDALHAASINAIPITTSFFILPPPLCER